MNRHTDLQWSVHGTAVCLGASALLLLGPSGAGKSRTAAHMMALGAGLIADDLCLLQARGEVTWVSAPPKAAEALELRGIGIVPVPLHKPVALAAAVWLTSDEPDRLPDPTLMQGPSGTTPFRALSFAPDLAPRLIVWLQSLAQDQNCDPLRP